MLLLQSRIRGCDKPACGLRGMQAGGLAAQSVTVLQGVRLPPLRLHAPISLRDCAISRRTIMNNAGSNQLGLRMVPPDIVAIRLCPDLC